MAQPDVLEGTWEELKLHDEELAGKRFRLVPVRSNTKGRQVTGRDSSHTKPQRQNTGTRTLTGMGKFAGLLPSSDEYNRQKQVEIELEDRKFKR